MIPQKNQKKTLKMELNSLDQIENLFTFLKQNKTFHFPFLVNGLFPAAMLQESSEYTGYSYVWVRDNMHIAHAHYINGLKDVAIKNVQTFADYFIKHKHRFENIITGKLDPGDPMNRPHIRFDGTTLCELNQKWSHAQNDALGYFLWLFCMIYNKENIPLSAQQIELMALFVLYFEKISYWNDEDNGHWEETRKIEASSIGTVIAALCQLHKLIERYNVTLQHHEDKITPAKIDTLIHLGNKFLHEILPFECIQHEPKKERKYDGALLFLIYPLCIIQDESLENQILSNVHENLQGEYGIRRYPGDSYWAQDYKQNFSEEDRTIDFSDNISSRDILLEPGKEAQWCIFDPVLSVIYGKRFQKTGEPDYLKLQIKHFNRSLSQLTGEDSPFGSYKCPELYYVENGRYIPNDTVPLLWTQANLLNAFKFMRESLNIEGVIS